MATEKRLIYLEDAIAKIVDTPSAIAERLSNCEYGYYQNPDMLVDRQNEIIDLLMDVPTVEVVHGRWEQGYPIFCSVCGGAAATEYEDANRYEAWLSPYCPNCGAKMDGDGND